MRGMYAVASCLVWASALAGQQYPPAPTASPFGVHPHSVSGGPLHSAFDHRLGDFDGDGLPDMICRDGGTLWWQRNLGNGVFGPYQPVASISAMGMIYMGLAHDFDGDGMLDIIVYTGYGTPALAPVLLLRRPSWPGGFAPPIPIVPPALASACPGPFGASSLCYISNAATPDIGVHGTPQWVCDFNVVRFDVATMSFEWIAAYALAPDIASIAVVSSMKPADLNGDGVPDIVAVKPWVSGSSQPPEIIPLLGVPPQAPGLPATFVEGQRRSVPTGLGPLSRLRLHDIDRDGIPDVVMVMGAVQACLGDGAGGFLPMQMLSPQTSLLGTSAGGFEIADFNLDGYEDVLMMTGTPGAASYWGYQVWMWLFPGSPQPGVFAAPQGMPAVDVACVPNWQGCMLGPYYHLALGLVDFDGDGDLEAGYWAYGQNGAPERYGLVRNDTVAAPGCSFAGPVPVIDVGPTLSGTSGSIGLRRAPPGGGAFLFASTGTQPFPACGGLIPDLNSLLPTGGVFHSATVGNQGTVRVPYSLPPSAAPINVAIYLQWAVTDPANPQAIRLSALRKVVLW